MKVIVAGGRDFCNYDLLAEKLDYLLSNHTNIEIVCGEAKGADSLGKMYAQCRKYKVLSYPADWDKYGKSAGIRRNREMAEAADALVAFWDGKSRGTKNMIETMRKLGKPLKIVFYTEKDSLKFHGVV